MEKKGCIDDSYIKIRFMKKQTVLRERERERDGIKDKKIFRCRFCIHKCIIYSQTTTTKNPYGSILNSNMAKQRNRVAD